LIPQRNISLLANRLAGRDGRRTPEAVIERDYCLAWLLSSLAQVDLHRKLAFKGGTALKRCYFGHYRFSEDLHFTLVETATLDEILSGLEAVYARVREASGIEFRFDRHDRHGHRNSHTFYLTYRGPLPAQGSVKVDITVREKIVFPSNGGRSCAPTTSSPTSLTAVRCESTLLQRSPARKLSR